jgi:hypothetical protein
MGKEPSRLLRSRVQEGVTVLRYFVSKNTHAEWTYMTSKRARPRNQGTGKEYICRTVWTTPT